MKLNELEIKISIPSEEQFKQVYAACIQSFGSPKSQQLQLDEYYDTPCSQLKKQDLVIRIRTQGGSKAIALKSPRVELSSGMISRIELEFLSAEGQDVHEQLSSQGLNANEAAEKERWAFIHGDCEIVLDRLPFIGCFVEIEGPSEAAISTLVNQLGLSSYPVVTQNYGELMAIKFQELKLPISNIQATFAKEAEWKNRSR